MAYTAEQLTALENAIATGALEVKYADKSVTYRSLSEMLSLRDAMKQELGVASAPKRRYARFNKGLGE